MRHVAVRTLTLNPSIDVASEAERVEPEKKIRTCCERIDPGGGGINVARVLHRFDVDVEAVFVSGGATGRALDEMLGRAGLPRQRVEVTEDTRTSLTVHERSTGAEYRFVPEGPTLRKIDIDAVEKVLASTQCDFLVASGSLPPGVSPEFYAHLSVLAQQIGARFILDTSGEELFAALKQGGIFLVKASKEEIDLDAARDIVAKGQAAQVALTLGADGALLLTDGSTLFLPALKTEPVSTVGSGDSFLAGMTFGFARGLGAPASFRMAVAFAAAATLSPGTDLAHPRHVYDLLSQVGEPQLA